VSKKEEEEEATKMRMRRTVSARQGRVCAKRACFSILSRKTRIAQEAPATVTAQVPHMTHRVRVVLLPVLLAAVAEAMAMVTVWAEVTAAEAV